MNHRQTGKLKHTHTHTQWLNISPVSYTHLDVYKRQHIHNPSTLVWNTFMLTKYLKRTGFFKVILMFNMKHSSTVTVLPV